MKSDVLDIFYQDYDGEMVLSGVNNFANEQDFLNQAQLYVDATVVCHVPLIKTNVEVVTIVVNDEGEWYSKMIADEEGFEGKELEAYKVDIDWESADR
jgi:hypothetical protein